MPPVDVQAPVISNVRLSRDYNVLTLEAPEVGALTEPGQFVMVKPGTGTDPLLRRPFSVFEVLRDDLGTVRAISILNKRAGRTTGLLYDLGAGDEVSCLGPLGLPFNPPAGGAAWMVAGGVGLAPFATLAEALVALDVPTTLFYGARTGGELYYLEFFDRLGIALVLATEDGSLGARGRITGPLEASLSLLDGPAQTTIYACGPEPMLAAVAKLAARFRQPSEVSMERTMGCGLGGCYSCVVPVKHDDGHTRYVRSCIGGPVFDGTAVAWGLTMTLDLSLNIGSFTLPNPLMAASGCFGYGLEYEQVVDLSTLGGVVSKGLFLAERQGHPPERIVETPSGMLNAIGLQGIGVHRFIAEKLPRLRQLGARNVVNICGSTLDEYVALARILSDAEGVDALELNISCPNIKEGGIQFGCSLDGTYNVVSAVRKVTHLPVIPKLTPNVTSPASFARAAEDAGADAISLVNTFLAMAIDVEQRAPKLANGVGGLSGPAIRPIAVRMVYECRQEVTIPIIGMGGIVDARDVLEFMLAGANAVQVGTANFVDPFIWAKLLDGLADYMRRHRIARLQDLVGAVDTARHATAHA